MVEGSVTEYSQYWFRVFDWSVFISMGFLLVCAQSVVLFVSGCLFCCLVFRWCLLVVCFIFKKILLICNLRVSGGLQMKISTIYLLCIFPSK